MRFAMVASFLLLNGCIAVTVQPGAIVHGSREGVAVGGSFSAAAGIGDPHEALLAVASGWAGSTLSPRPIGGLLLGPGLLLHHARSIRWMIDLLAGATFATETSPTVLLAIGAAWSPWRNGFSLGLELRAGVDTAGQLTPAGAILFVVSGDGVWRP